MKTAYYAIGLRCNLRCIFCPCSEEQPDYKYFTLEELKDTIEETLKVKDIDNFLLSGGEPTIQKSFIPIVEYICQEKKRPLSLLTNAIVFSKNKFLERFLSAVGNSKFEMVTAVHNHIPEKHDYLTQTKGSFEKTLTGLKNCVSSGINTSVKYNIVNYNYKDLPEFVDFIYETFPDEVGLILCNIDISGFARKNKNVIPVSFEKSKPYLEKALDKVIKYMNDGWKRNVRIFTTPLCTLDPYYWYFINKSTKDDVVAYRSPDVIEENSKLMFDFPSGTGTPFDECKDCKVIDICPGSWESHAEYYGTGFLRPVN